MIYIKYIITTLGLLGFLYGNPSVPKDEENSLGGIQFFTHYDDKPITSLKIPADSYLTFRDGFSLEFDFRIREKNPFGYILSMSTQDVEDLLVLSYVDFRNPDTSFIELSIIDNPTLITLPFPNELISRYEWHRLEMVFEKDFIQLTLNDSISDSATFDPIKINEFGMIFGGITIKNEPPRMDIREIKVLYQEKGVAYWPIDEMTGDVVHNSIGSKHGKVMNGEFLAGRHTVLHSVYSTNNLLNPITWTSIDQDELFYLFLTNDSLYKLNIQTWGMEAAIPFKKIPKKHTLMYDDYENQLFLFHKGGDLPVYTFDWEAGDWPNLDLSLKTEGQYYGAKRIYNSDTKDIYSFGGYGYYTYKNDIFKYSLSDERWAKVQPKLRNNDIFDSRVPKYVYGYKDKIYIIGGLGSRDRKQETGTQNYFDIWAFEWKTDSLYLVSEKGIHPNLNELIGFEIWEEQNSAFEFICKELDSTFTYYLNIFDFPHGSKLEFPLNFADYFDLSVVNDIQMGLIEQTSELLFMVRGLTKVNPKQNKTHFFTLALPLIIPQEKIESKNNSLALIIVLVVITFGGFWFYFRKRQKDIPLIKEDVSDNRSFDVLDKGVSVQLFGVFRMWIDGKEIFKKDWQSKKSRELFIYLILKDHYGVTREEISLTFWPNVASDSAKNSMGTSLSKIRKLLGKYKKHLITKDGRYFILHGDTFISDYSIAQNWLQDNNSNYKPILKLFEPNGLLSDNHEEWADIIKIDINQKFIKRLKNICTQYKESENWDPVEEIGEFILKWNPLDDEALSIYIQSLKNNGKPSIAHQVYLDFIKLYEKEVGESYTIK
ncbi:MAG: hypothetical protein SCARUB_04991 [Candidatus Scalindua rubra]|uniref:Uncharacterized protein n=1 Tax=Candidatus Scalindua rubra TaxID=1872076 RepID=A0A1E3X2Q3_9BACT|nr:MAG: hypothetical protein SCARUB_04991 [Candidatus Scalindua rubra]